LKPTVASSKMPPHTIVKEADCECRENLTQSRGDAKERVQNNFLNRQC
jgi:hypothetical protein